MSVSNCFDIFRYHHQIIPTLSEKYSVWVNWPTLIITIKLLDHYGNIIMIPVELKVDVDRKITLHDKVDYTGFNTHLGTIKYSS
jgi:hypothetical protein